MPFAPSESPGQQCILRGYQGQLQEKALFNLLHFEKRETSPHPGEGCGTAWAGPDPFCSRPQLPPAPLVLLPPPWAHSLSDLSFWLPPLCLSLSPRGTSARVSVLLWKLGSQCSRAAVLTRDPSLKEESLFVLLIGLCLKTQSR